MIISHKHKYLFVELPRTGTTAMSCELVENYGGKQILKKHATYNDFLKIATPDEKKYFVFASVRNPLDRIVSLYYKYKTNHHGRYTNPEELKKQNIFIRYLMKRHFYFVHNSEATFPEFFRKFYRLPFDDWSVLSHKHFNFVIHFESLDQDFAKVLKLLGIPQVRSLPVINKTSVRDTDFWTYYTPEIRGQAKWVFGSYMKRWGYEFPIEWGDSSLSLSSHAVHSLVNIPRKMYWKYYR